MVKTLLILAIFFSPIYFFLNFLKKKKKDQITASWKGKLVDKEHLEYEEDNSSYTKDLYTLHFRTNDGKEIKLHVPKSIFEQYEKGENVIKKPGSLYPEKI